MPVAVLIATTALVIPLAVGLPLIALLPDGVPQRDSDPWDD